MSAGTVTPSAPQPAARSSRSKRWLKRLLPLFTLLILVLWLAPTIVAKTPLRNAVARKALADVKGSVEVGGASLGWFAPVELRDISVRDESGRPVVNVAKLRSQKTLVNIAVAPNAPGAFTVEHPTISVAFEKGSTNVESAFAEYLKEKSGSAARVAMNVKVTGGTITLLEADTNTSTSVEGIEGSVDVPAAAAEPVAVRLTAATGELNVDATVGETGTAKVTSKGLKLDTFAPLLRRANPALKLSGALGTDLKLSWKTDARGRLAVAVAGAANGTQLALSAPWLRGDELRFDSVALPLDVELVGRNLQVRSLDLKCDTGTVSVKGVFDPEQATESLLNQPGVSIEADVNAAQLLAKLPKLFKLKGGIELHEGRLGVKIASKTDPANGGTVWDGKVSTSALKATAPGPDGKARPVVWDEPLKVEFVGRYASGRFPTFEKFVCFSEFMSVNAASDSEKLLLSANVLLGRLGTRLKDFVDLDGWTIDGRAFASLAVRRSAGDAFNAEVIVELTDLAVVDQNRKGWREPALNAQLNVKGTRPADGPVALAGASMKLTAGGDRLEVDLTEPVADLAKLSSGSAGVRLQGQVASWKDRLDVLVGMPAFEFTGTIDAQGKARFSDDRVTMDRLQVTLTKPKLERWVALDEPRMSAAGDLVFTRADRVATISNVAVTSDTLNVAKGTLTFEVPAKGDPVISGSGQSTVDLNRLGRTVKLYTDPNGPEALYGTGTGPLKFRTAGSVTEFSGSLAVTRFGYGPKNQLVWQEPAFQLEAEGKYDNGTEALVLAGAKVERPGLVLNTKGTLAKVTTTGEVNLTGTLRYDWDQLNPLMRKFVGDTFTATGTGSRGFALSGQLEPPVAVVTAPPSPKGRPAPKSGPAPKAPVPGTLAGLSGQGSAGWHTLNALGFDVGAVEVDAKMTRGVVKVERIHTTVAGGKASLEPTINLGTAPGTVTFTKGAVIDRAKITTGSLGQGGALRFALPAFSGAVQAEGEFSAAIEDNLVSLADQNQTAAKGVLLIHRATVGLTPVAAQVANLLGAKDTAMTLANETAVTVQVANGRVHHQNFAMRISGTTFHTSGSVGFDQSLDLVVDVPMPREFVLLKNNPVLQKAIAGKVLKVPLKGTLTKPELDPKALNAAIAALAREGAKDAGKDLIENEIKKLFPGAAVPSPQGGGFPFPFGKKP
ncbi:hypothetical protein R5W24_004110 [Gemmata sp. JC717]|uniref:hypothetical protein n=1 Tax=Gemmata algarum TaxID=2975278 RepID=UPI0021BB42BC|nr:hypothetical protein [Gemmata algarum]MDY3554978.1 hypothetical protein [Gemmata algarum]